MLQRQLTVCNMCKIWPARVSNFSLSVLEARALTPRPAWRYIAKLKKKNLRQYLKALTGFTKQQILFRAFITFQ